MNIVSTFDLSDRTVLNAIKNPIKRTQGKKFKQSIHNDWNR